MPVPEIVAGVICTLGAIGGLLALPRAWGGYFTRRKTRFRGQLRSHGELSLIWWPFGEVSRRGAIRGLTVMLAGWCGAVLGFWLMQVSIHSAGAVSQAARVAALCFFVLFAVALALFFTVMFFNWPKSAVPPRSAASWARSRSGGAAARSRAGMAAAEPRPATGSRGGRARVGRTLAGAPSRHPPKRLRSLADEQPTPTTAPPLKPSHTRSTDCP